MPSSTRKQRIVHEFFKIEPSNHRELELIDKSHFITISQAWAGCDLAGMARNSLHIEKHKTTGNNLYPNKCS